jgi:hypothetical protein
MGGRTEDDVKDKFHWLIMLRYQKLEFERLDEH